MSIAPSLAPLARAIRAMGHQFSLHFVRSPLGSRAALREQFQKLQDQPEVPMFAFASRVERGAGVVASLLESDRHMGGIVLLDGEALLDEDAAPLQALNLARDRLAANCHGPFVIACTPEAEQQIARLAPDLFSVRSTVAQFGDDIAPRVESISLPELYPSLEALRSQWKSLLEHEAIATPEFIVDRELDIARHTANAAQSSEKPAPLLEFCREVLAHCKALAQSLQYERAEIDATVLELKLSETQEREPVARALRSAIQRLSELGAEVSEANAWLTLSGVLRPSQPVEADAAVVEHALPLLSRAHRSRAGCAVLLNHVSMVTARDGAQRALDVIDAHWAAYQSTYSPVDRSQIVGARSLLHQLLGDLDLSIELSNAARLAARESRDTTALALALHREVVARGARRSARDRAVVAELLPEYRAACAMSPALDWSTMSAGLDVALVRLDLAQAPSPQRPMRVTAQSAPRNRAERRKRHR